MGSDQKRYAIALKPAAVTALEGLPKKDQKLIGKRIGALATDPRPNGSEKLKGADDLYRIRSGNYRVLYQIFDDVLRVLVVTMGHRKDVYDELRRRMKR